MEYINGRETDDLTVPDADSTDNQLATDVLGNKSDAAATGVVSAVKSVVAYIKQLVTGGLSTATSFAEIQTELGMAAIGRAITATLYVSPNGDNSDGLSWTKAYTTIQAALDAASTDANECTLILIGINTGANHYDIDTTGDPAWAGNYVLQGTHRTWQKIMNDHDGATSVMKFTGYVSLRDLNINLGTGNNGVIITKGAFRVRNCQFVGEDLEGTATALHIDGATTIKHGIVDNVHTLGHATYMTGLKLDNCSRSLFERMVSHSCLKGIHIDDGDDATHESNHNIFHFVDIGDCDHASGLAIDIDKGDEQHFDTIKFHHNTRNVDDEVGDHTWVNIHGHFPIYMYPDDFTGITVASAAGDGAWGSLTDIVAANAIDNPFRIVGTHFAPAVTQKSRVRFTAVNGAPYYDDIFFAGDKREGTAAPSGTEFIFNTDTRIEAMAKVDGTGPDNIQVWVEIQEI